MVRNSLFHLYDPVLKNAVARLYDNWSVALSFDEEYSNTPSGKIQVFSSPGDMPLSPRRQAKWDKIKEARSEMHQAREDLLKRLRTSYVEIKIMRTNKMAWQEYVNYHKDD